MGYNYTIKTQIAQWAVEVDPVAKYGYFESQITGSGGGLWFDKDADGLVLVDYDGVFELPCRVILALDDIGAILDPEFLPSIYHATIEKARHAAGFLAGEYGHAWIIQPGEHGFFEVSSSRDAADIPAGCAEVFHKVIG